MLNFLYNEIRKHGKTYYHKYFNHIFISAYFQPTLYTMQFMCYSLDVKTAFRVNYKI